MASREPALHLLASLADHDPAILQAILQRVAERADREPWLLLSVAGADAAMRAALSDESAAWSTARDRLRGKEGLLPHEQLRGNEQGLPHDQLRAWCESTHARYKRIRRMRIARMTRAVTRHLAFHSTLYFSVSWVVNAVVKHIMADRRPTIQARDVAAIGINTLLCTGLWCAPQIRDGARALLYARKGL